MRDAETLSADPRRDGWIRASLGADGLTPNIAWLQLVEGPHSVFRFPLERDRAEVLEGTFEQWPANATIGAVAPGSIGFFKLHERTALPWLLLNGQAWRRAAVSTGRS